MDRKAGMFHMMRRLPPGMIWGIVLVSVVACASEKPKPMVQPTTDQVRGHAGQSFDNLKKEEQGRSADPPVMK